MYRTRSVAQNIRRYKSNEESKKQSKKHPIGNITQILTFCCISYLGVKCNPGQKVQTRTYKKSRKEIRMKMKNVTVVIFVYVFCLAHDSSLCMLVIIIIEKQEGEKIICTVILQRLNYCMIFHCFIFTTRTLLRLL